MAFLNENAKRLLENDSRTNQLMQDTQKHLGFNKLNGVINERDMNVILENTYLNQMNENATLSSDIAQFAKIVTPITRRVYPNLVANHLIGIQPLTSPTGYIYALVNRYTGHNNNHLDATNRGMILVCNDTDALNVGDTFTGSSTQAVGRVIYKEGKNILVTLDNDKRFSPADDNVTAVFTNEATFHKILKNFTGAYKTTEGEKLASDMSEVGLSIEKKSVEAVTRKLKARYTLEMYEDLKAQHGIYADIELITLLEQEIKQEIDREIIDFVNTTATPVPNAFAPKSADGRWEIEKYRTEFVKISCEAQKIGLLTKWGAGNTILCSPKVVTMLEQIGKFVLAPTDSSVIQPISGGFAGYFDNRYKVIVDQYATDDYVNVMFKGDNNQQAIGFFSPYVPLSFQSLQDPTSGQPVIIARTRYALTANPLEAENYGRIFGIDFSNTALA